MGWKAGAAVAVVQSTANAVGRFRFQPLPRPGASVGCTGQLQMVRYSICGEP